jgi:hypothetical protein
MKKRRKVVIVVASATNGPRVRAVARWVRALLPAAALVVAAPEANPRVEDEDTIVVAADELPSGPLSLADALTRGTVYRNG